MMQIDRNTIIDLLTEKPHDGVPVITVFKGKPIDDMTDEEFTEFIYFVIGDYHRLGTLLDILTKPII